MGDQEADSGSENSETRGRKPMIIDFGQYSTKYGFANTDDDGCKITLSNITVNKTNKNDVRIGNTHRFDTKYRNVTYQYGMFEFIEGMSRCIFKEKGLIDQIFICDKMNISNLLRERMIMLYFEEFDIQKYYSYKSIILSLFQTGHTSGISFDFGHLNQDYGLIHDGIMIAKGTRFTCGAHAILKTPAMETILKNMPHSLYDELGCDIIKKYGCIAIDYQVESKLDAIKIKENSLNDLVKGYYKNIGNDNIPNDVIECLQEWIPYYEYYSYELPDGSKLTVDQRQIMKSTEIIFEPKMYNYDVCYLGSVNFWPFVDTTLSKAGQYRNIMFDNVAICGGISKLKGFKKRIEYEMRNIASKYKYTCKDNFLIQSENPEISPFIGASVLSQLSSFDDHWINKSEYDEHGPGIIYKRILIV